MIRLVLCPCIAGSWVYYFNTLDEIDKIRLDGTGKTKVCGTESFGDLCGSTEITASYKDGDTGSYPAYYFSLDTETGTVTEVKN
ncbi:hypothetical protein A7X67_07625 [Clostridium sp. W14A]|nr:hypothetical protein A7X67_07625 [Clostridium sp. W14A]